MTTGSNRSASLATLAALLLAGSSACGGSDDDPPDGRRTTLTSSSSATPTPTDPAPSPTEAEAAYREWLAALKAHDAAGACARHAPEFTIELRLQAILFDRAELGDPCTGFVAVLWEDPAREYDPTSVEQTQVTEEDAFLAVDYPGVDETVTMARTDGSWYVADTSPRSSGGSDPAQWVASWCDLAVGMGRDEVIGRMGEPSGEYTVANGGEPQLWWANRQYDFRAYLDPQGRVLDLVGDYDRLSAADLNLLDCAELR